MITGLGGLGKTELLTQALKEGGVQRPVIWVNVEQHWSTSAISAALRSAIAPGDEACSEAALPLPTAIARDATESSNGGHSGRPLPPERKISYHTCSVILCPGDQSGAVQIASLHATVASVVLGRVAPA